ncbi:COX15/CtaA family protein [Candidatus Persebacteraceae bacterium Df01]|jgi:cytochrome c oxidase assembly protein subunit 15|uniref:COX15/CtaA family protein n=1 Tax=Candidatus Doriopsillibacter californiensis TaxID=2970740 RepID=A0ABT7QK58_9GAMM|nr:COX15/CtaA family protein [Candidatus Persebacteraceae bacterium Df01]
MIKLSTRGLLAAAAPLALLVIVAGAFTRLSDAGLGCPDWPACYGQLIGVPDAATAAAHSPDWPLDPRKAWIEVGHRYIAGLLGLVLFAAAVLSLRSTPTGGKVMRNYAPTVLAVLVAGQALLGMLTVTDRLRPLVVSSHLLGGLLIIATIAYALATRPPTRAPTILRIVAVLAAATLAMQIFLGGWVSTNYAALACPDFPLCQNGWTPPVLDWRGFELERALHKNMDGSPISSAALATIHWVHRIGALVASVVLSFFAILLWRHGMRGGAVGLLVLLTAQIALGIINVVAGLPIWAAVAHNGIAALLAASVGALTAKLFTPSTAA